MGLNRQDARGWQSRTEGRVWRFLALPHISPSEELGETVRVLIVDDHRGFRRALVTTLGMVQGLEVAGEAADGTEAITQVASLQPDVVLMDLSMPGISGIEAMQEIHRWSPDLPVIILTAHADPAIEREALARGASGFIAKGGGLQELVDHLKGVIDPDTGELVVGGDLY
jgi:DNA-binding NarL/FixJ family response regulator